MTFLGFFKMEYDQLRKKETVTEEKKQVSSYVLSW